MLHILWSVVCGLCPPLLPSFLPPSLASSLSPARRPQEVLHKTTARLEEQLQESQFEDSRQPPLVGAQRRKRAENPI